MRMGIIFRNSCGFDGALPEAIRRYCSFMRNRTLLKLVQLRWTNQVTRMPDERLPKKVFYGELQERKRSQGGQKKRYKDTVKASLKDFNIPLESWEQAAQDRSKWRCLINKGAAQFESKGSCEANRKRKERKARQGIIIRHSRVGINMLYLQSTV